MHWFNQLAYGTLTSSNNNKPMLCCKGMIANHKKKFSHFLCLTRNSGMRSPIAASLKAMQCPLCCAISSVHQYVKRECPLKQLGHSQSRSSINSSTSLLPYTPTKLAFQDFELQSLCSGNSLATAITYNIWLLTTSSFCPIIQMRST